MTLSSKARDDTTSWQKKFHLGQEETMIERRSQSRDVAGGEISGLHLGLRQEDGGAARSNRSYQAHRQVDTA